MIKGIGTDIVTITRIEETLIRTNNRFAERILTPYEQEIFHQHKFPSAYLAKRFAAKEAAVKALGTGIGRGISWQHMQIENDEYGAPVLIFSDSAKDRAQQLGVQHVHLSIADETNKALAFVVLS